MLGGSHSPVLKGAMGSAGDACPSGAGAGNKAVCLRHHKQCYMPVLGSSTGLPWPQLQDFQ